MKATLKKFQYSKTLIIQLSKAVLSNKYLASRIIETAH